jgi:hypothetical protein
VNRLSALLFCLFLTFALSCAGVAEAASTAILRPRSSARELIEVLFRLQGELLAVGVDVEIVARPAGDASDADAQAALWRMADAHGLDAIIDIVGDSARAAVDIWFFERAPGRADVSRVVVEASGQNSAETLAIRAIDAMRSRLVEMDLTSKRKRPAATTLPAMPTLEPHSVEHVGVAAGAVLLTSLDGVGPAILPLLRFDWALHSRLSLQVTLAALGSRPSVASGAGSAHVSQAYGVLGLCYCQRSELGISPFAAVAVGASRTSLAGDAKPPALGHTVEQWSFVLESSLGARLRLRGPFYFTLAGQAHVTEPYVSIHLSDSVVASSGRPNLLLALTAGAWL